MCERLRAQARHRSAIYHVYINIQICISTIACSGRVYVRVSVRVHACACIFARGKDCI